MKRILIIVGVVLIASSSSAAVNLKVIVEGVEGPPLQNILSSLTIEQQKSDKYLTEAIMKRYHNEAQAEIRTALQPFGYYKPTIRAALQRGDDQWIARYSVDPGPPVKVERVNLAITGEGEGEKRFQEFKKAFPLKQGAILNQQVYEEQKQRLQQIAAEDGFLDARFTAHEVRVFLEKNTAIIDLQFDTGPQYRFGEVTFKQNILREKLMQHFVPFREGDPYSVAKLLDLQSALYQSDYFSEVQVQPRRDIAKDLRIPIEVVLTPRKRQNYLFGVGYGTDTGFRGVLGYENHYINKRGHRFTSELRLAQIRSSLAARYIIPMRRPETDHLDFTAAYTSEDTKTSTSDQWLLSTSFNQLRHGWQQAYYINFISEKFSVGSDSGTARLILPGVSWIRTKADNRLYPRHGSTILFEVRGTHRAIGSSDSFILGHVFTKHIRSFWKSGRFIIRGEAGAMAVTNFSGLPPSQRFFAGGDRSVRGYSYNTLGAKNEKGEVIGGRNLLVGSFEYDQRIYKKWGAAVFYDAGNAFNDFFLHLKQGAGVGVRWQSPIGVVRVDFAYALDQPHKIRLHFAIGPEL